MKNFRKMIRNSKGATAIEYGLLAALISVAAVSTMGSLGTTLGNTFGQVGTDMTV